MGESSPISLESFSLDDNKAYILLAANYNALKEIIEEIKIQLETVIKNNAYRETEKQFHADLSALDSTVFGYLKKSINVIDIFLKTGEISSDISELLNDDKAYEIISLRSIGFVYDLYMKAKEVLEIINNWLINFSYITDAIPEDGENISKIANDYSNILVFVDRFFRHHVDSIISRLGGIYG